MRMSIIIVALVAFFFIFSTSCSPLKFAYLKYDSATLTSRLNTKTKGFIFQFSTTDGNNSKTHIQAIAYYSQEGGTYGVDALEPDHKLSKSFSGNCFLGNNGLVADTLRQALTDPKTGRFIPYKYVLFIPTKTSTGHIAYDWQIVSADKVSDESVSSTQPCPPAICLSVSDKK